MCKGAIDKKKKKIDECKKKGKYANDQLTKEKIWQNIFR